VTSHGWHLDGRRLYELLRGSGTPETMTVLDNVRRTRNLLLLRGLLDVAEHDKARCAEAAQLWDNFATLSAIESLNPQQCTRLVAHPHVSAWLVTCLKHMSRPQQAELPRPLWADLGHLGTITIAAAIATGAEVEATVPAYDGMVVIPTVGRVRVGDTPSWRMTTLRHLNDGTLTLASSGKTIAASGAPEQNRGLQAPRWLSASCDGLMVSLELDDLNPYRDCHLLGASDRLSGDEVEGWRRKLADGWAILATRHRGVAESVARGLNTLVPLTSRGYSQISATSRHAPGAVALTPPQDGTRFACTLVHELQHTKLCLLMELAPLRDVPSRRLFYSPWRDDPRPLAGLLHGLYAGIAVADFWRVEYQHKDASSVTAFQFARARRQVETALESLLRLGPHAGQALVAAVRDAATSSQDVPVSSRCARLADDVTLDHAVRWRLRNLTPADREVELLTASWRAGTPPPSPQATSWSGNGESFAETALLRMAYTTLLHEDSSRTPAQEPIKELPHVTGSHGHLLSGDYRAAAAAYERDITAGVRPVEEAWAGLAVALHGQSELAAAPLNGRPELVRAVYERLAQADDVKAAPSPADVARWMVPVAASQAW
jgi:HEXXH motif-containing protein